MAKKIKDNFLAQKINQVNKVINKLEGELERAYLQIIKQKDKSGKVIKRNFEDIIDKINANQIYSKASEKTDELTKDIKKLADDVLNKVKKVDLSKTQEAFNEVRENIDQVIGKFTQTEVVEQAKEKAVSTRNQVLHILNVPTKSEVDSLTKKVGNLERKIKILSGKAAQAA